MAATPEHDNRRGILLMCAAMAGFALEDMFIKIAAAEIPAGQILFMLGLAGAAVFVTRAVMTGHRVLSAEALRGAVLVRNLTEVGSSMAFIYALTLVPLATYSAILQATPLLVTLGAALFLREGVGWRRWTAILVGLLGVMLIIRPGGAPAEPAVLVCIVAVILMSVRDLATRMVPPRVGSIQLAAWAFLGLTAGGAVMMALEGRATLPSAAAAGPIGAAMVLGSTSYFVLILAMRSGELSVIAPFRYSRIVFALLLAVLVLGERPDAMTLAGAAIVVASGLYTLFREARLRRQPRPSPTIGQPL